MSDAPTPSAESAAPRDRVLEMIDAELERLAEPNPYPPSWIEWRQRAWWRGVMVAREVAAGNLREIRDAYVVDELTREGERIQGVHTDGSADARGAAL